MSNVEIVMVYDKNRGVAQFLTDGGDYDGQIISRWTEGSKVATDLSGCVHIMEALSILMHVKWHNRHTRIEEGLYRWESEQLPDCPHVSNHKWVYFNPKN